MHELLCNMKHLHTTCICFCEHAQYNMHKLLFNTQQLHSTTSISCCVTCNSCSSCTAHASVTVKYAAAAQHIYPSLCNMQQLPSTTFNSIGKGKVFFGQELPSGEFATSECGANYQLIALLQLKFPNWELPVAVDHSQLRTMASETVDPLSGRYHLPFTVQYSVSSTYCKMQMRLLAAAGQ